MKYKLLKEFLKQVEDHIETYKIIAVVEDEYDNVDKGILIRYIGDPYLPYPYVRRIDYIAEYIYDCGEFAYSYFNFGVPCFLEYKDIIEFCSWGHIIGEEFAPGDEYYHDVKREFYLDSSKGIF